MLPSIQKPQRSPKLDACHEAGGSDAAWRGITKVWASQYNDRAYKALAAAGADALQLQMAVLVQPVVAAQYAWVAHTWHPITGGHFGFRV